MAVPAPGDLKVYTHPRPSVPPAGYQHYGDGTSVGGAYAAMGTGFRFNITGLTHDKMGFPTGRIDEINWKMDRLQAKIEDHRDELVDVEEEFLDDAEIVLFAYGGAARTAQEVVRMARAKGIKAGLLRPRIVWPFPDVVVASVLAKAKTMLVVELNQGQLINEVQRVNRSNTKVVPVLRYDGEIITPDEIIKAVEANS
jgi:2-oxoglutarate ferredoxin oxidoreductase subunit alpha